MSEDLKNLRDRIDALDIDIQRLLSERASVAEAVAKAKRESGDDSEFYRAEREAEVLRRVKERNNGPLSDNEIARLFREIMSACLALEQKLNIAFLGPNGTYTQTAALKHFGHSVDTLPLATIADVFNEVETGAASYGVVPIENSTEGIISHTLDQFIASGLCVCGEVELRIHHCLMGKGADLTGVTKVYSHRQSFGQCRRWLDNNLRGIERMEVSSNAEAARLAASDTTAVAIAGAIAAELYGLNILSRNIEDQVNNTTRFLVIGKRATPPSGDDKTSLLLITDNKPGALYRMLEPLARNGISMTRIESRPSGQGMWNYVFFVDVEGHQSEPALAKALQDLAETSTKVKVLGSYPRAVL
ncbi:MAG: prephenate dehydratase [Gammaproteobacteria bacterium]|nr:prephenate dehydratase [Gammaproteobacteria bacterium]MDH5652101.1 prephenate dehydratase [Gammaproteobacteria bacterium]